jgi:NAD(P)H-hydrate epimerase
MATSQPTLELVLKVPRLAPRAVDGNKGTYGRVLAVAGSRGMSGAAVLCASAMLRSGAGLVRIAVPDGIWPVVASGNPCYMTAPLPQDEAGRFADTAEVELLELARTSDVVAIGPGLGRSDAVTRIVIALLKGFAGPMVLDADGLNAVVGRVDVLRERTAPLIITPHPGEFSRLVEKPIAEVQQKRVDAAGAFATTNRIIVVLKGSGTVVTDGRRFYQNTTGNPGMATGGTGDVLTGVIAALLGQGMDPFEAAQLGVYMHGLAGDLARDELGEVSVLASDLLTYLPRAFRSS